MLTEKYKTYQRILPQFAALKRQAVDKLKDKHETGLLCNAVRQLWRGEITAR
jgi:hypothetical protein